MTGPEDVVVWLEREGLPHEQVEDDTSEWHVLTRFPPPDGPPVELVCPSNRPHIIIVGRRTNVADEHQKALSQLPDQEFRQFRFQIVHDLLMSGRAQFKLDIDDAKKKLKSFNIVRRVWIDGLTPTDLYLALQDVHDLSTVVTSWIRLTVEATP